MKMIEDMYNAAVGYGYTTDDVITVGAYDATCETKGFTGDSYKLIYNAKDNTYSWQKVASGTFTKELGHQMEAVESKAATCKSEGWTVNDYYICTRVVGKNQDGTPKLCGEHQGTVTYVAKTADHNWQATTIVANTCQDAGLTVVVCKDCGNLAKMVNNKYQPIANKSDGRDVYVTEAKAAPHVAAAELKDAKEATCTEVGYTGDKVCKWCGIMLEKGKEIPMKEHTVVDVAAVEATCTEAGATAGTKCSVCGTVLSGCEKIDALGHKYENGVCTVCGEKDPNYKPEVKNPFTDVKEGDAFYEDILWAADKNIVDGIKADDGTMTFQANGKLTRAQVVQMLWNANGKPEAKAAADFSDVAADAWYAKAVAWAVEAGVINGMGDGTFAPNAECTRAQFVKMLWVINGSPKADAADFSDVAADAWYAQAVAWAAAQEVTLGDGEGHFLPDDSCTRGQAVAFLHRAPSLTVTAAE